MHDKSRNVLKASWLFFVLQKAWRKRVGGRGHYSDYSPTQGSQEFLSNTDPHFYARALAAAMPGQYASMFLSLPLQWPCRPWQGAVSFWWDPEAQNLTRHGKCSQKAWNLGQLCTLISFSCSKCHGQLQMISSPLLFRYRLSKFASIVQAAQEYYRTTGHSQAITVALEKATAPPFSFHSSWKH